MSARDQPSPETPTQFTPTKSQDLSRMRRIRGGHRTSSKRLISAVDELIETGVKNDSLYQEKSIQLKITLEGKLKTLQKYDEDILNIVDESEIENEIENADNYAEVIQLSLVKLQSNLSNADSLPQQLNLSNETTAENDGTTVQHDNQDEISNTSSSSKNSSTSTNAVKGSSHVKLPKLDLIKFSGDLSQWNSFWDSFEAAIEANSNLADIDRFNYLNSLLEGAAKESIKGLSLTSANYKEAILILQKRFGNKQMIINRHMDILMNAKVNSNNLKDLRQLYDIVETQIRSLKSLGVSPDSYGTILSGVLMNKLPLDIKLIVSREMKGEVWDLDHLLSHLLSELEARERTTDMTNKYGSSNSISKPNLATSRKYNNHSTASALLSTSQEKIRCSYCRLFHPSNKCTNVSSIEARLRILRRDKKCYVCLKTGHRSFECNPERKCQLCQERHHISICPTKENPSTRSIGLQSSNQHGDQRYQSVQNQQRNLENDQGSRYQPSTTQGQPYNYQSRYSSNNQYSPQGNRGQTPAVQNSLTMYVNSSTPVLLPTARTSAFNPKIFTAKLQVHLVFDCGSQRTYVTCAVRTRLKLPTIVRKTFMIKTFGAAVETPQTFDVVRMHLQTDWGEFSMLAIVVPRICDSLSGQLLSKAQRDYTGLKFADYSDGRDISIDILIGSDEYWNFVTGDVVRGENGTTAMNTCLGWVLIGPVQGKQTQDYGNEYPEMVSTNFISSSESDQVLQTNLQRFWDLESLGIESRSLYEQHVEKIKFVNGRYEVELPWKSSHPKLPDNYDLSLLRLKCLMRKLRKNSELLTEYTKVMKDQLTQGIVEKVDNSNYCKVGRVHYLPHHPVIRQDKTTTKLRIVYDASAKREPSLPSLNDCLFSGPPLTEKILDIMLRFRVHHVALASDIEKAFLMISMANSDRDVLRFLWYDNPEEEDSALSVYRFTRVTFGVSSSPFLLNATIKYHLEQFIHTKPELVTNILRSIYVDDISTGSENVSRAYELYEDMKSIFAAGGFNLRKFVTNSPELREKIMERESQKNVDESTIEKTEFQEEDESYTKFILGHSTSDQDQKILGVKWNFIKDKLVIDWSDVFSEAKEIIPTKRLVVSVASRFYDPLGFLSPFIVQFKLLFQELCKNHLEWDEPLSGEQLSKWRSLIQAASQMKPIYVSRCYFESIPDQVIACYLHGFCDASAKAYGAVVYLKIVTETSNYVRFLTSKTRISPINTQTIPRLELLSALILARLISTVTTALEHELQINGIYCWTDSKVAFYWIHQEAKEWKQFIQNRVDEIRRLVPANVFNHCSGLQNPADIPSRGMNPLEFVNNSLWINGPEWLISYNEWTVESKEEIMVPEECLVEMKVKDRENIRNSQVNTTMLVVEEEPVISRLINCQNYSHLHRLLRVTANVLKFIEILKSKFNKDVQIKEQYHYIKEAELLWVKDVQGHLVKKQNFQLVKRQLEVYEDNNGILRCKGRLGYSNLPEDSKYPILLDSNHHFTSLVVINCHRKVMHNGVKETLTELRSRYWIVRGRQYVRRLIHQCAICRKYNGHPYQAPTTPPLPEFRVQETHPFTFIGVDYAGPLFIKNGATEVQKVWLCLFTCCVTRAVHLEIVPDMLTLSFLRCFERFVARRGYPSRVISDNGKTFKSAAKVLQENLIWSFNIEKAPWWGGMFERMIQSVKRCLKKTIGGAKLSYDELVTVVIKIESVLNSRPISFLSTEDVEEPLTPCHLMYGRRIINAPDSHTPEFEEVNVNQDMLRRRVQYLNQVTDHFWRRWSSEYLLELRNRYSSKMKSGHKVSIGDVVIVHNENLPRCRWKIGRVVELFHGADNQIRAVKLRVLSDNGKVIHIQRPVQKLYPLEMSSTNIEYPVMNDMPTNGQISSSSQDGSCQHGSSQSSHGSSQSQQISSSSQDSSSLSQDDSSQCQNQRPRRVAAQESDRKRKEWIKNLMM